MAKKKPSSPSDLVVFWVDIIVSLILIIVCFPDVPWAWEDMAPHLGPRFSTFRYYSPISAGDSLGTNVPWTTWRSEICSAMNAYLAPNGLSVLGPLALKAAVPGDSELEGGAALGCRFWPACVQHVKARCTVYTRFAVVGIIAILFLVVAAITCWVSLVMMSQENQAKKKKYKEEFANYCVTCQGVALASAVAATLAYSFCFDRGISELQRTAYYPRPAWYVGFYFMVLALVLLFVALVCSIFRARRYIIRREDDHDDQAAGFGGGYDEYGGADYGYPPPDPNMPPPGYGAGYAGY